MIKSHAPARIYSPVVVIIFTAITVQLIGNYHANSILAYDGLRLLWIILRIIVPLIVFYFLKMPWDQVGLGAPVLDRNMKHLFIVIAVVLVAAFAGIYFYQGYVGYYAHAFSSGLNARMDRFIYFMTFTASTLTGWEFLHRGFLLMGLLYFLKEREKIRPETAAMLAVCIVWIFEVVFHFIKPQIEALGLLAGSPLLSYIALRTRSIWPSFFIHLLVEILFIAVVIFQ